MKTLWIGLGGALGTVARYHLDGWVQARLGTAFPYGTLLVNVLGSFCLALLMQLALGGPVFSPTVRVVLATGVLGGFTTYSTFNFETLRSFQNGAWGVGALYVAATILGCLGAGALGWVCGRALIEA